MFRCLRMCKLLGSWNYRQTICPWRVKKLFKFQYLRTQHYYTYQTQRTQKIQKTQKTIGGCNGTHLKFRYENPEKNRKPRNYLVVVNYRTCLTQYLVQYCMKHICSWRVQTFEVPVSPDATLLLYLCKVGNNWGELWQVSLWSVAPTEAQINKKWRWNSSPLYEQI